MFCSTAYNTPEEFQMNWITPQQLDGRSLTPGATVTLSTAALTRSSSHGVRIVPSWCAEIIINSGLKAISQ